MRVEEGGCLCGCGASVPLWTAHDRPGGRRFRVVRCPRCGVVRTTPRLRAAELERYYPPAGSKGGRTAWLEDRLRAWLRQRRARSAAVGMSPGCVLDVGCGDGRLLAALQAEGWQAIGVERDAKTARRARRRGIATVVTDMARPGLPDNAFDLVILWHALEHLPDPSGALCAIRGLLRDGGRLVVAVPNLASWQARLLKARWFHLDVPRHLWHFTPETLEHLLRVTGFQVVARSYCLPAYELRGWFEAIRGVAPWLPGRRWTAWGVAALLSGLLWPVAHRARAGAAMVFQARPKSMSDRREIPATPAKRDAISANVSPVTGCT